MTRKRTTKKRTGSARRARGTRAITPAAHVEGRILVVRGQRVLLAFDLAAMYRVSTGVLNQAVRRNRARFPEDFMFQLTWDEAESLRSQFVILNKPLDSHGFSTVSARRRSSRRGAHLKFRPYAFTEQGVAMLSSVLRSPSAVKVNIEIMRAFVRLRQILASHADLARRLDELESKYDGQFSVVFDAIRALMSEGGDEETEEEKRPRIGFRPVGNGEGESGSRLRRKRRGEPSLGGV